MNIENFEEVSNIIEQIKKYEGIILRLSGDSVVIQLDESQNNVGRIMTIGAWPKCEHPYRDIAIEFITQLRKGTEEKILKLKERLKDL